MKARTLSGRRSCRESNDQRANGTLCEPRAPTRPADRGSHVAGRAGSAAAHDQASAILSRAQAPQRRLIDPPTTATGSAQARSSGRRSIGHHHGVTERVDALMRVARAPAYSVLASAADALGAGAPLDRIQGHFVTRAARLLSDSKAHAVLAASGDEPALTALERRVEDLAQLRTQLDAEFGDV